MHKIKQKIAQLHKNRGDGRKPLNGSKVEVAMLEVAKKVIVVLMALNQICLNCEFENSEILEA